MLFYFGQRFDSATAGTRLVGVECDQCATRYFFELARVGTASAAAPYGLGSDTAADIASAGSQTELQERLASEAELVPCPACHWINEELVSGYRQSRYRAVLPLAFFIAVAGLAASFMSALFVWNGPQVDHWLLPWFLAGGTSISLAIFGLLQLVRNIARSRIRPNREFPATPRVPAGTPPALLLDEPTERLVPADPDGKGSTGECEWFEVQIGRHQLPDVCCECLGTPTEGAVFKHILGPGVTLQLPRCRQCARSATRRYMGLWFAGFLVPALIGIGLLIAVVHDDLILWILAVCHGLLSLGVAAWYASSRSAPARISVADLSRGIVRLRFRNPEYRPQTVWSDGEQ